MLTAVSSGTTDMPSPSMTRRKPVSCATVCRSAMSCAAGGNGAISLLGGRADRRGVSPYRDARHRGKLIADFYGKTHLSRRGRKRGCTA